MKFASKFLQADASPMPIWMKTENGDIQITPEQLRAWRQQTFASWKAAVAADETETSLAEWRKTQVYKP